ncbi:hypothetical protein NMG60_11013670 [Bertholletia excelsa]
MCLFTEASPVEISQEEFNSFHDMDRKLYSLLTEDFQRDPIESMGIMAFWLWLERSGSNGLIKKILSLPNFLIIDLADEAQKCLNCLKTNSSAFVCQLPHIPLPLTQTFIDKDISLQYLHENRQNTSQSVAKILTQVCSRAMTDIMQQVIERKLAAQQLVETHMMLSSFLHPRYNNLGIGGDEMVRPLVMTRSKEVPPDDRTMFVTFSKGYPVAEREIREFFMRAFGDCVEDIHMQEVGPAEQALFARIVFYSPSSIQMVLNGMEKAKFTINGKHVWMRKFVPKRKTLSLSLSPPRPQLPPPLLPLPNMPAI